MKSDFISDIFLRAWEFEQNSYQRDDISLGRALVRAYWRDYMTPLCYWTIQVSHYIMKQIVCYTVQLFRLVIVLLIISILDKRFICSPKCNAGVRGASRL